MILIVLELFWKVFKTFRCPVRLVLKILNFDYLKINLVYMFYQDKLLLLKVSYSGILRTVLYLYFTYLFLHLNFLSLRLDDSAT